MKTTSPIRRQTPALLALLIGSLFSFLLVVPYYFPSVTLFHLLEWITYDLRVKYSMNRPFPVASNLGAVYVTDASLAAVNDNYGFPWPWPRQLYGRLIDELAAQGAKLVAFDILFRERHELTEATSLVVGGEVVGSDEYFARRLAATTNTLLAAMEERAGTNWQALLPAEMFRTNAGGIGHIVNNLDPDGRLRRARAFYDDPVQGRIWHMGVLMAARELGLDLGAAQVEPGRIVLAGPGGVRRVIPVDADNAFLVDWGLQWNDERIAWEPFERVLQNELRRSAGSTNLPRSWMNRLVLVGAVGSGNNISDIGSTPLSSQTYLVSVYLNVANSVITGRFISRSGPAMEMVLILSLVLLAALITWNARAVVAVGTLLVLLAGYVLLAMELFAQARYWLPVTLPFLAALVTQFTLVTYRAVFEGRERRRIKAVFSKIVSPDVVNELLQAELNSLSGTRREVTVYFADIRGFTRMTDESQSAAEEFVRTHQFDEASAQDYLEQQARDILSTVNLYLGVVAETIKHHEGTLDKYIGDCVMAFWGAPIVNERHAVDCVRAAIDAQRAIHRLNREREEENERRRAENEVRQARGEAPFSLLPVLTLGSGINTGMSTVGLMGSDAHVLNYTVFGREVNLANRLEAISGSGRILISQSTFLALQSFEPSLAALCAALPPATVKGFREPVPVFEVRWQETGEGGGGGQPVAGAGSTAVA